MMLAGAIKDQEEPTKQKLGERASEAKGKASVNPLRGGRLGKAKAEG